MKSKQIFSHFLFVCMWVFSCKETGSSSNEALLALVPLLGASANTTLCPKSSTLPSDIFLANTVESATANISGFSDSKKAINGVCGAGELAGSLDVYALDITGAGASMILSWGGKTVKNVTDSIDFIVYDNSFRISSDTNTYAMDPSVIQVSLDGTKYCGFNPSYTAGNINLISSWTRFGGLRPVFYNMTTNPLSNEDLFINTGGFLLGGGDGFDLEDLDASDPNDVSCEPADVTYIQTNGFKFIKITSASAVRNYADGTNNFPWPPGSYNGSDIDGVVAREMQ
ncbi:LIC_13355 family lipoprotein [Leptospira kemamanensis]|uniref:LIC_13355 family lipoprotein n=1 Tax=Leptospira kemamanensis TaxID=2484942 RepID=A0A4R9JPF9_9LEPT|nr:LIC_13355 family lipoprotein [Leptospira kemamanensis]TGL51461.1 LIC_13355 family lipoprotein [Leptospira kemamanensis]